jgi:ribose/xylose/arabinose/galactoside ABC-type transport system permease subunit/ABC-type branched-subunit amino acid transport system ATPase component
MSKAGTWYRQRARNVPGDASGRIGLGLLALAVFGLFSLQFGANWYSLSNILTTLMSISSIGIAVTGSMALLISGNVDLSIGSMYALVAVLVGEVASHTQSTPLAILAGLGSGAALGAVNGIFVRLLRLSPLIVTIATLALYGGLAYAITKGETIYGFPSSFMVLGQSGFGQLHYAILIAAAIFIIGSFVLVRTRSGLRVYAIGGNSRSAELAGVPVGVTTVALYTINGMLIGVVAILATSQLASADPGLGVNFEFDVITAAILGGVAFAGGGGRPLGVFLGVALIGIVDAGVIFEGLQSYWQQVVQGALLLVALASDQMLGIWRKNGTPAPFRRISGSAPPGPQPSESGGPSSDTAIPLRGRARAYPRAGAGSQAGRVLLEANGLTKRFGPVVAVQDASLKVRAGEVLCLVGDNGAGKSTLIQMLSGAVQPDQGTIRIDGSAVHLASPKAARGAGIQTVYQDLAVCGNLSVTHNLVLGEEPVRRVAGVIAVRDDTQARRVATERLQALGVTLNDYDIPIARLSGGQRQSVAIARAMEPGVKVVILDEPTAALGVKQTQNVLRLVRSVAERGSGVLLITHDVEVVFEVADSVAVLRLGSIVHSGPVDQVDELSLLRLMAGLNQENYPHRPDAEMLTATVKSDGDL